MTNHQTSSRLSKSKYLAGLQCSKRLWLEEHEAFRGARVSPALQHRFECGRRVQELARTRFPHGLLIRSASSNPQAALHETRVAIAHGRQTELDFAPGDSSAERPPGKHAPTLFEGCFLFDDVLVRVDILNRIGNDVWELIEVKSSTGMRPEHIDDLAVQNYVLDGAGLQVGRAVLMHLNRECRHPDLGNLFVLEDVTDEVVEALPSIPEKLERMKATLQRDTAPEVSIGAHCHAPDTCPFVEYCWRHVPEKSIFTIPSLGSKKKQELIESKVLAIADLPEDLRFSRRQEAYLELVRSGQPRIETGAIRKALAALQPPLYFLDFETDSYPIPRFPGDRPYEQVPFQYSCHILDFHGNLTHVEFLRRESSDPRPPLVEALIRDLGDAGSVVVYNAHFEANVLRDLANRFREQASALRRIRTRLWDQLEIFKKHFQHPDFLGSNSLKAILPVLVPALSYDALRVQSGDEAQALWHRMLKTSAGPKKQKMAEELLEYCRLDTLAMVEIHRYLERLVR